jgi:hypothetical protein
VDQEGWLIYTTFDPIIFLLIAHTLYGLKALNTLEILQRTPPAEAYPQVPDGLRNALSHLSSLSLSPLPPHRSARRRR